MLRVDREQVLAFRLNSHNLSRRLRQGSWVDAAGACGIQNTPPGSAELAMHARVAGLSPADITQALADKSILQVWSLRQAAHLVPTRDAAVFTLALVPSDDAALKFLLQPILSDLTMEPKEAVERTAEAVREALTGKVLTKDELHEALRQRLPEALLPWCEPCRMHHVKPLILRMTGWMGVVCFAPERRGDEACFLRTDEWLAEPQVDVDREAARAELVRRYLRCYGPSTASDFAEWAGIQPAEARRFWRLIESELIQIDMEGRRTWLHSSDVPVFSALPTANGVRLLPPGDPYLLQRDRETLLPEKSLHRRIWRLAGRPGVALVDGRVAGTWRQRKKGKRLVVSAEMFALDGASIRREIEAEAACLALYRGCESTEVEFLE